MAGPMWSGAIHDGAFVSQVLEHLEENQGKYGTTTRMKGMLTVANEVRNICKLISLLCTEIR
jgi:tRNA (guanine26-N2/guanine27-N2)-dimethyltransferase